MVDNGEYKLGVEHRLTEVETTIKKIETNHLPHMQAEIENTHKTVGRVVDKQDKFMWLIITTLITVLVGVVMIFFKK